MDEVERLSGYLSEIRTEVMDADGSLNVDKALANPQAYINSVAEAVSRVRAVTKRWLEEKPS
jgi:hypothetical protein